MSDKKSEALERFVIIANGSLLLKTTEISEDWAWLVFFDIKRFPSQLTDQDRFRIEKAKLEGYRAVKCKIQLIGE